MRITGRCLAPVLVTVTVAGAAGCGSSDKSSSDTTAPQPAVAKPSPASVSELQQAASDLVRETSNNDAAGAKRALESVDTAFEEAQDALEESSPATEEAVKRALAETKDELERGDLDGASRAAKELRAATGSSGSTEKDIEPERSSCKRAATSKPTGLPSSFPAPDELTITEVRKEGPTTELDGYFAAPLGKAYPDYTDAVTKARYTVLHKERDPHDAEINYRGSGRQGQIALQDNCAEQDVTRVHITSRPA